MINFLSFLFVREGSNLKAPFKWIKANWRKRRPLCVQYCVAAIKFDYWIMASYKQKVLFKILHVVIKAESIRKLRKFNFQWTKTLYQNNFNYLAFFFTLFEGYKCHKWYEITPKKSFLWEPEKTNFKSFKFHKNKILLMTILPVFSQLQLIFFLRHPKNLPFGIISYNLWHL